MILAIVPRDFEKGWAEKMKNFTALQFSGLFAYGVDR